MNEAEEEVVPFGTMEDAFQAGIVKVFQIVPLRSCEERKNRKDPGEERRNKGREERASESC